MVRVVRPPWIGVSLAGRFGLLALSLALGAFGVGAEEALLAERRFDSSIRLKVFAVLADGSVEAVGRTPEPNRRGLLIPKCRSWFVIPAIPSDDTLRRLAKEIRLRNIPGLVIEDPSQVRRGMNPLAADEFVRRTGVRVDAPGVTERGLSALEGLTGLHRLVFRHCRFGNDGLARIARLKYLEELELSECREISDEGFASLYELPGLVRLNVSGRQLTDRTTYFLSRIRTLQTIEIGIRSIGNRSLEHLANLPFLNELVLMNCGLITNEGLACLGRYPALRSLKLWEPGVGITDHGLVHVGALRSLRSLELWQGHFGDDGMAHLAKLFNLERLMLWGFRELTDDGLNSISQIRSLSWLTLYGSSLLTDAGLDSLRKMKSLRKLEILECPGVTAQGIQKFRANRPGCQIDVR